MSLNTNSGWKRLLVFLNLLSLLGTGLVLYSLGEMNGPSPAYFRAAIPWGDSYSNEYGRISWQDGEETYTIHLEMEIYDGSKEFVPFPPIDKFSNIKTDWKFLDSSSNKEVIIELQPWHKARYETLDIEAKKFAEEGAKRYWQFIFKITLLAIAIPSAFVLFLYGIGWVFRGFRGN